MSAIVSHFSVPGQMQEPAQSVEERLSEQVAAGLDSATKFMCTSIVAIAHAAQEADVVTLLILQEVVSRAASLPENVTVSQLLQELNRRMPEDAPLAMGRR
jgi:hypothetical protein